MKNNTGYSFVEQESTFYAIIPDVEKGHFVTGSIQILAAMDSQRRLEHVDVKTLYTGP